ncbi:MAG: hypoxanthine-guanine phosphoribosyltransferase [Pseudomonadales bacterium]|nr:hypoxanthine-guanine phosphoribosyltransferase [Pseudomonadales bacterium]
MSEYLNQEGAQVLLDSSDLLFSRNEIDFAFDQLAIELTVEFAKSDPVLICVMSGGLTFTSDLMQRLRFPLTLDFLQATPYQKKLSGDKLSLLVSPRAHLKDKTVIILDDVLDYGNTLAHLVEQPIFKEAAQVITAVMLDKKLGRDKLIEADYAALSCGDRYVFGRGMDCQGYWRNLPEIYAAPGL